MTGAYGRGVSASSTEAGRLYAWYRQQFFDFEPHLSPLERAYIQRVIELEGDIWSYDVNGQFEYSMITFSHRVSGDRVNSARVAFASVNHAESLRPVIAEILRHRGVSAETVPEFEHAVGLGWDIEADQLKVYSYPRKWTALQDPEMKTLVRGVSGRAIHSHGYVASTFVGNTLVEKKVYVGMRERLPAEVRRLPFGDSVIHTNLMVTTGRGVVPQVDLRRPAEISGLNGRGQELLKTYETLGETVDTVAYANSNEFTLYFP